MTQKKQNKLFKRKSPFFNKMHRFVASSSLKKELNKKVRKRSFHQKNLDLR